MVIGMLPNSTTTKEKILGLVKVNKTMTVLELAAGLNITEMAVRRHLQMLETDNLLLCIMKKNMMGRPSKVYQLTEKGEEFFPKQYKQIGLELLQEIQQLDETIVSQAIVSRQKRLISRYQSRFKGKDFKTQVKEMVKIQSESGFMAEELETNAENIGEIKQANCPYLEIAKDFPEICRNEHKLFEELFETTNITKVSSMSRGENCCQYVIRKD
jgi:DeoR family transcriptional regulator, suf operon transcriptional repressor